MGVAVLGDGISAQAKVEGEVWTHKGKLSSTVSLPSYRTKDIGSQHSRC